MNGFQIIDRHPMTNSRVDGRVWAIFLKGNKYAWQEISIPMSEDVDYCRFLCKQLEKKVDEMG